MNENGTDLSIDVDNNHSSALSVMNCEKCGYLVPASNMVLHQSQGCQGTCMQRSLESTNHNTEPIEIEDNTRVNDSFDTLSPSDRRRRVKARLKDRNSRSLRRCSGLSSLSSRFLPRPSWESRSRGEVRRQDPVEAIQLSVPSSDVIDIQSPAEDRKVSATLFSHRSRQDSTTEFLPEIRQHQEVFNLLDDDEDQIFECTSIPPIERLSQNNAVVDSRVADDEGWVCSRCTLINAVGHSFCEVCRWSPPGRASSSGTENIVRPADPIRTERLVEETDGLQFYNDSSDDDNDNVTSTGLMRSHISYMGGGAVVGGVLGTTRALIHGQPLMSAVVEGAVTGAVGGALVREVFEPSQNIGQSGRNNGGSNERHARRTRIARHRETPRTSSTLERARETRMVITDGVARGRRHRNAQELEGSRMLEFLASMMDSRSVRTRNIDTMSYEQLLQVFGDGTENMGVSEELLTSLPVSKINNPEKELPPDHRQCLICLDDFQAGEDRMILPCLHGFHETCAMKWLLSNGTCPICKNSVNGELERPL